VTPFTVQVTAVLVVFATEAVTARVPVTGTVCAVVGAEMETATAGGVVFTVLLPLLQPAITISRLKLIPKTQAERRRPGINDLTSLKPDFRFDSFDI
jgi:hypothetical protein